MASYFFREFGFVGLWRLIPALSAQGLVLFDSVAQVVCHEYRLGSYLHVVWEGRQRDLHRENGSMQRGFV